MADLKNIAQMGVNEVFEDLAYNVAYGEVYNKLNSVIPLDDGYLKDAVQSGLSVMFSGALMIWMQRQDKFITIIFSSISASVISSLSGIGSIIKGKLSRMVGRKLKIASRAGSSSMDERIAKAKLYVEYGSMIHNGQLVSNTYGGTSSSLSGIPNINISSNTQKLEYAKAKLDSTHKNLLLKLFTSRFTADDIDMIKKMTGKANVDIDNLNKIANFMYVTDDSGNITGLTEQFMTMLNGLGYLNNKQSKG
ncbi:hypothetical protein [Campylobacter fetus]|uniref:hypothetical protein n=1 Tax=Campylobacter fetus TaxID=196 RepID=UPI00288F6836|nr:hypothetical protein [Campylobacter fetus subsp. venerealis]